MILTTSLSFSIRRVVVMIINDNHNYLYPICLLLFSSVMISSMLCEASVRST